MRDITLSQTQIDELVQRLKGTRTPPSESFQQVFAEAGMPLAAISAESLEQLENALTRCDKCGTYQATADMEHANEMALCRECMGSLTYGQASGG
jgi:formylmethanofuran dehydrogenase subunit E